MAYTNFMYCEQHSRFIVTNGLAPENVKAVNAAVAKAGKKLKKPVKKGPAAAADGASVEPAVEPSKKEAVPAKKRDLQAAGVIKPAEAAAAAASAHASEPKKRKVMKPIQFDVESSDSEIVEHEVKTSKKVCWDYYAFISEIYVYEYSVLLVIAWCFLMCLLGCRRLSQSQGQSAASTSLTRSGLLLLQVFRL